MGSKEIAGDPPAGAPVKCTKPEQLCRRLCYVLKLLCLTGMHLSSSLNWHKWAWEGKVWRETGLNSAIGTLPLTLAGFGASLDS